MDRQQFFRLAGTVMALPWLDLFTPPTPTPVPSKIDLPEVEYIRSTAVAFRSWDNTHGGGLAREAVFAQLRWSAQLLHADCPERLRPQLFSAVANLSSVAGYMAFDAFAHDDARRAFGFGVQCAEMGGNWELRAKILHNLARQSIWRGQADETLTYAETALVRGDRLIAGTRAALHAQRAGALAKLGRVEEALAAVGAADDEFGRAEPQDWSYRSGQKFYDHAEHQSDTGRALFDLAITGRKTQSAQRLAYAVEHHDKPYARARAISQTKLASLLMATGDPREAAAIGQHAVNAAAKLRSGRVSADLRELRGFAEHHAAITEVAELRERITETLDADGHR